MKPILDPAQHAELRSFATPRTLFAFDFDGTLAPIVADPERAQLPESTRLLLARLSALAPCVVISGRSLADLGPRVAGLGLQVLVGNHGAEWKDLPDERDARERVDAWLVQLRARLHDQPGVIIEDKGLSVAIHFRAAPDQDAAARLVHAVATELPESRLVAGKCVLNLVPAHSAHKGIALRAACARFGCDSAVFVGDDVTDEDAFAMQPPPRLLGVRVGVSERSSAGYFVTGQDDVDTLLALILELMAP